MISKNRNLSGGRTHLIYLCIGLGSGFLAGLFGLGGGIVIVPALMYFCGFSPKQAAGTSLFAIIPISLVGTVGYGIDHNVFYLGALFLIIGSFVGAKVGVYLLNITAENLIRIVFLVFVIFAVINLFLQNPQRDVETEITVLKAFLLILVGFVVGVVAGLLGVGGGLIVVPVLILLFGISDLVAKGTSLLMIIPTSISGSLKNYKYKNLNLTVGLYVGISACVTTYLGTWVATLISEKVANILLAILLAYVGIKYVVELVQSFRHKS